MPRDEILQMLRSRFGSEEEAANWLQSFPVPGYSGTTPAQLVEAGHQAALLDFIAAVDAGVYA